MTVLFIVHAISWSDKACSARPAIQEILERDRFDRTMEVVPVQPEIRASRYLHHGGEVLEHGGISPVPFFRETLFGTNPLFPRCEHVTLVGGHLNETGGGCLNVAFGYLAQHIHRTGKPSRVAVPLAATYNAGRAANWGSPSDVEQVARALLCAAQNAGIRLEVHLRERMTASADAQGTLVVCAGSARGRL